jgi:hypothetical protein
MSTPCGDARSRTRTSTRPASRASRTST